MKINQGVTYYPEHPIEPNKLGEPRPAVLREIVPTASNGRTHYIETWVQLDERRYMWCGHYVNPSQLDDSRVVIVPTDTPNRMDRNLHGGIREGLKDEISLCVRLEALEFFINIWG